MKSYYINRLVKKILTENNEGPEGLKKLQDAVKAGCLKGGKIRADKQKIVSTGQWPADTNFYYYFKSKTGNIYLIRPNLSIWDWTNKKDLGKTINCPQVQKGTGWIEPPTPPPTAAPPPPTAAPVPEPKPYVRGEITPPEFKDKTGEELFDKLDANFKNRRTKPFINIDRYRIVFKGDVSQNATAEGISVAQLQSLDKYIKDVYGYDRGPAVSKRGGIEKYVWTGPQANY